MISISWQLLIRKEFSTGTTLALLLFDEEKVNNLIETIKQNGANASMRTVLNKFNAKEKYNEFDSAFKGMGNETTFEEFTERLERIKDSLPLEGFASVEPILDEAILLALDIHDPQKETTDADEDKFQELSLQIKKLADVSLRTMQDNPIIRRKLRIFRDLDKRWLLTFGKIPEDSKGRTEFNKNIEEFSKMFYKNMKISDSFIRIRDKRVRSVLDTTTKPEEGKKFTQKDKEKVTKYQRMRLGRPSGDGLLTFVASDKEFQGILDKISRIKSFFEENIVKYEPKIENLAKYSDFLGETDSADILAAKGIKFTAKQNLTGADVTNYLEAIRKIAGKIGDFIPKRVGNKKLPSNLFLTRESDISAKTGRRRSPKSIALNPYANAFINNTYRGDAWFRDLFSTVLIQRVTPKPTLEVNVLDDITFAVRDEKGIMKDGSIVSPKYNIPINSFANLELSQDNETARKQINEFLKNRRNLSNDINDTVTALQNNQLSDTELFKYAEIQEVQELWTKDMGRLQIVYLDSERNELTPAEVSTIVREKGAAKGIFGKILYRNRPFTRRLLAEFITEFDKKVPNSMQISGKMEQLREIGTGITQKPFVEYLLSLTDEQIKGIISDASATSAKFTEKLDPLESLGFLLRMSLRLEGENRGLVKKYLKQLVGEDDVDKKREIAEELDDKMENLIAEIKVLLLEAFQGILNDFAQNWATVSWGKKKGRIMDAIQQFKATDPPLLTGGDE